MRVATYLRDGPLQPTGLPPVWTTTTTSSVDRRLRRHNNHLALTSKVNASTYHDLYLYVVLIFPPAVLIFEHPAQIIVD